MGDSVPDGAGGVTLREMLSPATLLRDGSSAVGSPWEIKYSGGVWVKSKQGELPGYRSSVMLAEPLKRSGASEAAHRPAAVAPAHTMRCRPAPSNPPCAPCSRHGCRLFLRLGVFVSALVSEVSSSTVWTLDVLDALVPAISRALWRLAPAPALPPEAGLLTGAYGDGSVRVTA